MLNMILAMNRDGLIGINNELPWHLPQDLKRFKELTNNKTVIMGKKYISFSYSLFCRQRNSTK